MANYKKEEEKLYSVTIRLDLENQRILRMRAEKEGVPMSRVVREIIMRDLRGDKGWMRKQKT